LRDLLREPRSALPGHTSPRGAYRDRASGFSSVSDRGWRHPDEDDGAAMSGLVARLQSLIETFRPLPSATPTGALKPAERKPQVVTIAQAEPPWRWRIAGTVDAIAIDPRGDLSSIEARVSDGTGWLVARWLGWQSLRGLRIRRTVILEGFIEVTQEGEKLMFDPDYEIL
jgi:hypothetical protein